MPRKNNLTRRTKVMNFNTAISGISFLLLALYMTVYGYGISVNHNETLVRDTSNQ
jgi:hypothetical protein